MEGSDEQSETMDTSSQNDCDAQETDKTITESCQGDNINDMVPCDEDVKQDESVHKEDCDNVSNNDEKDNDPSTNNDEKDNDSSANNEGKDHDSSTINEEKDIDSSTINEEEGNDSSTNNEEKDSDSTNIINEEKDSSTQSRESKEGKIQIDENECSEVKVQLIDIPDDDDLFDFLTETKPAKDDELKKTELYKYLTDTNQAIPESVEVTPYQSGDEQGQEESGEGSSSDSENSSSSEDFEEVKVEKAETEPELEPVDTPLQLEDTRPSRKDRRRYPERKPIEKKPSSRKKSSASSKATISDRTLEKLEHCKQVTDQWLQDLSIPENLTFSQPIKMQLSDLNQYMTCGLCKGYLYEASTITECMHTFCKNCIVRHCMEVSLHCPVCSILIHPTDPFVNIRLDRMIQDIVYKLLPSVAETEMKRIEKFYAEHPEVQPQELHNALPVSKGKSSPKESKEQERVCTPSVVSVVLESEDQCDSQKVLEKKFVRVSSCATVESVCEFLKKKLSLEENHSVDLFCCGDAMDQSQSTLLTIKQHFFGDQEELIFLQYRIRET